MKIFKSILVLTLCGVMLMAVGCGEKEETSPQSISGSYTAVITVKDLGDITVELDADSAPITVANFINLVNDGFYDGLTFHRVIENFMIQGGDPEANGSGGSDTKIKGEFSANGINNPISHQRGVISMARSNSYNSASSQFFIMHKAATYLDGNYAAFGKVISGMDIVDKIAENTPVANQTSGYVSKENQPVIESIRIVD